MQNLWAQWIIVSNKHRDAYDKASQVLGSLAETYLAMGKKDVPLASVDSEIPEGKVLKDHESPCLLITPNREQSGYLGGRGPEEGIGDTDHNFLL